VDIWVRGPGEDEQPDRGPESSKEGGLEAGFLGAESAFHDVRDEVEVEVADVDGDAEQAGDKDAGEDDANHTKAETVHWWVDKREDFKEGIVDAVDDGGVDVYKGDSGVLDCDFDGFDQGVYQYGGSFEALLVDLALGFEAIVASKFAEAVRAAEEDVGSGGLGDTQEHEDEYGASKPEDLP